MAMFTCVLANPDEQVWRLLGVEGTAGPGSIEEFASAPDGTEPRETERLDVALL